jgi:hypothetical protein
VHGHAQDACLSTDSKDEVERLCRILDDDPKRLRDPVQLFKAVEAIVALVLKAGRSLSGMPGSHSSSSARQPRPRTALPAVDGEQRLFSLPATRAAVGNENQRRGRRPPTQHAYRRALRVPSSLGHRRWLDSPARYGRACGRAAGRSALHHIIDIIDLTESDFPKSLSPADDAAARARALLRLDESFELDFGAWRRPQ